MHTKLATSIFALAVGILASQAHAADIYNQGSTKDAPASFDAPQVVNWSGFYIQGQVGYGNSNHDLSVEKYRSVGASCSGSGGVNTAGTGCNTPGATFTAAHEDTLNVLGLDGANAAGLIGGGRVGFDIARSRFLFGVFGEYNFSSAEAELNVLGGGTLTAPKYDTYSLEKGDEWSIGARVGYIVAPRTLAYVLAAYTQADYTASFRDAVPTATNGYSKDVTFDGVSVGGGVEFALTNNVFLGMEYAHTFYGEESLFDDGKGKSIAGGTRVLDSLDEDKVMATLKFKLNTGVPGLID